MRRRLRRRQNQKRDGKGVGLIESVVLVSLSCAFLGSIYFTFSRNNHTLPVSDRTSFVRQSQDEQKSPNSFVLSNNPKRQTRQDGFLCKEIDVTDGDTFRCGKRRIRLAGIDAPELPGHCRTGRVCTPGDPFSSRDALAVLLKQQPVRCFQSDTDRYGRTIASCEAGGVNLSCSLVRSGHAVQRYGGYPCGAD